MFFAALGLVELLFLTVFFVLLVVGITYDRQGRERDKWWILGIGAISIAAWYWKSWTLNGAWAEVTSWDFWKPVGYYLLFGLGYSIVEFILDIRRSATMYADLWAKHLTKTKYFGLRNPDGSLKTEKYGEMIGSERVIGIDVPYSNLYTEIKEQGAESANFNTVLQLSKDFIENNTQRYHIVGLKLDPITKVQ